MADVEKRPFQCTYYVYSVIAQVVKYKISICRSGLSWKHHLDVGAGVIDSDYRGNIGVILFNLSHVDYNVKQGDRIAQLIVQRICTPDLEEVEVSNDIMLYCCLFIQCW